MDCPRVAADAQATTQWYEGRRRVFIRHYSTRDSCAMRPLQHDGRKRPKK